MQRQKGISLVDILIVLGILFFAVLILAPMEGRVKRISPRVVCGTNLKGLGTACRVYSNDYEDKFPQFPGTGAWSKKLGFAFDLAKPDFKEGGEQGKTDRTITASWYLLVREADVSPKAFVCPEDKDISCFDGKNPNERDLVELWDFGNEPHKHVSYVMHNPYGAYPTKGKCPATFAVGADMSPWFQLGDFVKPDSSNKDWRKNRTLLPPYFSELSIEREKIQQSNALSHKREGQNVMFADGHSEYVKTSDVGFKHDNIYTYWSTPTNPTENDIRIGTNPTSRSKGNDAQSPEDSFLAI